MVALIEALTRYPVKGLSGQSMDSVRLVAGQGFPGDRQFGFARPDSGFDPNFPRPLPKSRFYMLARDATLARLSSQYDDSSGMLSLSTAQAAEQFDISRADGKRRASEFLKAYLDLPETETPELYEASPHRFTDVAVDSPTMMNTVSLINLDSVAAFSRDIGQVVDPRRFRGNITVSGLPAFSELDGVGQSFSIGSVRLKIVSRTQRCAATTVNLGTGQRDISIPTLLERHYGHRDMGVYCEVLEGGEIYPGEGVDFGAAPI
jgi:uncharacterized protein YcbX